MPLRLGRAANPELDAAKRAKVADLTFPWLPSFHPSFLDTVIHAMKQHAYRLWAMAKGTSRPSCLPNNFDGRCLRCPLSKRSKPRECVVRMDTWRSFLIVGNIYHSVSSMRSFDKPAAPSSSDPKSHHSLLSTRRTMTTIFLPSTA